ncbi:MAG: tyrosine-type recombinase/integrase, partial [Rhabdochlamydiaceae bacterium]
MRAYLEFLNVRGWDSDYKSVQNLLNHLARKTQSEKSRANYLEAVYHLCLFKEGCKSPDELVPKPSTPNKDKIDRLVQSYIDDMRKKQRSIRYINVTLEQLKAFYRANGYKKDKEIEVERYHQSARYRKRAEYVPTADEVMRMVNSAITPKWKAIVLALYTTGFRNSTLRAILYSDIKAEMEGKKQEVIHVPVYPEMKKLVPDACKNSIPYHAFFSKEATEGIRSYLAEYEHINGAKLLDSSPLFPSKGSNDRPMKARSIQDIIKKSARLAGIKQWKDVYPHCIRKSFENAVRNSGLDVKDQEFLMGHILPGAQDTYMDKTRIEEFRSKHERIKFFQQSDPESMRRQAAKDQLNMLEALGVLPREQLQKLRLELDQRSMDEIDWTQV